MSRLRCLVEYDGTGYEGWQVQLGRPTIQEEIEHVLKQITGEATRIHGSGRTDSGVHAVGQVAHFDIERHVDVPLVQRSINAILPAAIAIRQLEHAPPGFHARYSAHKRTYEYTILNSPVRAPLRRRYALHVGHPLDVVAMTEAARSLVGTHDFGSFGAAPGEASPDGTVRATVRELFDARVTFSGTEVKIKATANAFLTHMMRRIAALLIDIGSGKAEHDAVKQALLKKDDRPRSRLVPAHGLCLMAVDYGEAGRKIPL